MTGFDGLIDAREKQISDIVRRTGSRTAIPGVDRSTREQTTGEALLAGLGAPEEVITKAIGGLFSDSRKYDFSEGIGNYHTQTSFADLFRDSGMDPDAAAILGIAAAILNPLDPLNKIKILGATKLGKGLEAAETAGKNLVKGSDGLYQISKSGLQAEAKALTKSLDAGLLTEDAADLARSSISRINAQANHADELNELLLEVQKRGADLGSMRLAGSMFDQVRLGQRQLIGFGSMMDFSHVPGMGNAATDASVVGWDGPSASKVIKAVTGTKNVIVKPLKDTAYKVADYIGIPTTRSEKSKQLATKVHALMRASHGDVGQLEADLASTYMQFIKGYGPEGIEAAKMDAALVTQAIETKHSGVKQMALDVLAKIDRSQIPTGKGAVIEEGRGLSDEQKIRLTQSGVADEEIPVAIGQFDAANTTSARIGKNKQHEVKLLGKYIVVKTSDPVSAARDLDDLDGIYGNRVWAKHERADGTFLVQKRHPGAARITKTNDFDVSHLKNLESIAAQISRNKKGLTVIGPEDILVSPSGAVQIINPSVITDFKSQKEALANSRVVLDNLANTLSIPRGSARELTKLRTAKAANAVPRGVNGLTFRSALGGEVVMNAHDLMEQAVNTAGFKDYVRASYDHIQPDELAKVIGDPTEFERANSIEFHREQIRKSIQQGQAPAFQPIRYVRDDAGNLHVSGIGDRARLTAAILEGLEVIPIAQVDMAGDTINLVESGFYAGKTVKLSDLWQTAEDSSSAAIVHSTRGIVASNYSLVPRGGDIIKLADSAVTNDPRVTTLLTRLVTLGPTHSVGAARTQRITSASQILTRNFGSLRNGLLRASELAEASPDLKSFVEGFEAMLINPETRKGLRLDNTLRHPDAESLFAQLKNASSESLDALALRGVFTTTTIKDTRRLLLASDASDLVVRVMDADTNTLRMYSNTATTQHLKNVAESYITKTVQLDDVEPLARLELTGADGVVRLEVRDLVSGTHPRLADVLEPTKVFSIAEEHAKALQKEGVYIADKKTAGDVRGMLAEKYFPKAKNGKPVGVLLQEKEVRVKSLVSGQYIPGTSETIIRRPEFTYFVTRSGALVLGTKHRNVKDLLTTVFEEGPAYFEEFGVMTAGKIIVSNPFGAKMSKIGVGEVKLLQDRVKMLATRFKDLGFEDFTVLDVNVPFNDAIWREMFGENVTIGSILKDDFKLKIPENLKGHTPDLFVLAPARIGGEAQEMGVVGIERTRLANKAMNDLFKTVEDMGDKFFLNQVKQGLPISYHSSWLGRHLTKEAKEAIDKAYLTYPDKESKTFKNFESAFKGRVLSDLTTLEINTTLKRLQKEGTENAESIISDIVMKLRDGYVMKPTAETASTLVALSKLMPEGIDFFHYDPIWATALSGRQAERAITRSKIVDSIKEMDVAVWHGTAKELDEIKTIKNKKYVALEKEIVELNTSLTQARINYEKLTQTTPDIIGDNKIILEKRISTLTENLAQANAKRSQYIEKLGKNVMGNLVDLESKQIWIKGEDLMSLIDRRIISQADVIGDPSDAFVRVPVEKYGSLLDEANAEVFLFPKEIAGVVQKYFQTTTKDGFGKFLSLWDSLHSLWRSWTLFPIPAYHVRNGISSAFMAYLGGVTDLKMYNTSMQLMNIIDGHRKGTLTVKQVQESLGAVRIASASGQVYTGQQIYDEFVRHGGLAGGLHYNEFNSFGNVVRQSEFERLSVKAGMRPSSELAGSWLFDNAALRLGVTAAAWTENRFRLASFIDSLSKGRVETQAGVVLSGFEAASIHMKRVFYDYSDLSAFERSWLRRVIPFYSWSRHNVPRMLQTLITDPVKHYRMAEYFHEVETGAVGGPVDENSIPEWLRNRFGIVVQKLPNGSYVVKTGDGFLPMIDAYKMLAGDGILAMVRDGITPFVKTPIEQMTNYSWYSGNAVEKVPGQRAQSFTLGEAGFSRRATTQGPLGVFNLLLNESLLRTFFRPGGEIATKILDPIFDNKEGPSTKLFLFGLFIGKAYEIDPEQTRMAIYRNWSSRRRQLQGLRNQALEEGDLKSVEDADRMMTWLTLQYPGEKEM